MKTLKAAGIVIFTRTQPAHFLLLKHSKRWDLPKGHAEPDESLLETALRETEEETGIDRDAIEIDPGFAFQLEYEVEGKRRGLHRKSVTYYLGFVESKMPVGVTEHLDFKWFKWPAGKIQAQTIDPLLQAVDGHFRSLASKN